MQEVDLDNVMKYQKTKSNYMEFSRICAQIMKWKKIDQKKFGQVRPYWQAT